MAIVNHILEVLLTHSDIEFFVYEENGCMVVRVRPVRVPVKIDIVGSNNKESKMINIDTDTKETITVSYKDSKGHPTTFAGAQVSYTVAPDGIASLFPSSDGMSCDVLGVGPGSAVVTATLVVSPTVTLTQTDQVTVAPGLPASLTITEGTPVPQ